MYTRGGQRTASETEVFPSIIWVPGPEHCTLDLRVGAFTCCATHWSLVLYLSPLILTFSLGCLISY